MLFNGLTIKYLMIGIKFVKKGIIYERMKIMVKERLIMTSITKMEELKKYSNLDKVNWQIVEKIMNFKEETRKISKQVLFL